MKFDLLHGNFPIGGWVCPPGAIGEHPSFLNEEQFKLLEESGINLMYANREGNGSKEVYLGLELAEKHNVYYLVNDRRYVDYDFEKNEIVENFSVEEGKKTLQTYLKYKSFAGIALHDEPHLRHMKALGIAKRKHKEVFEQVYSHTNLFPIGADSLGITFRNSHEPSSYDDYLLYLNTYIKELKPKVLSYDAYPFVAKEDECSSNYFEMLEFFRNYSDKINVPFWCFVQVTSWHKNVIRNTTEREIRWIVNTSLAFGAKGITYFTYCTPVDAGGENFEEAMIDRNGKPTDSYYYVKKINKAIQKMGQELLQADLKAIIIPKKSIAKINTEIAVENSYKDIKKINDDYAICSYFEKNNEQFYLIVNGDVYNRKEIKVEFNNKIKFEIINNNQKFYDNNVTLNLDAGEGVLFKKLG